MLHRNKSFIRPSAPFFAVLHRWVDLIVILGAFAAAVSLHHETLMTDHWISLLLSMVFFYLISDVSQLYASWRGEYSSLSELRKVGSNWAVAFAGVFIADHFIFQATTLPDLVKVMWFAFGLSVLWLYRVVFRLAMHQLRSRGFNSRSVAIAGAGPLGVRLGNNIVSTPWLGLNLVGYYDDKSFAPVKLAGTVVSIPISGNMAQLIADARAGHIDKIYVTLPMRAEEKIKWLLNELSDTTASVYLIPDVFVFDLLHARSESINGLPSISIFDSPMDGANRIVKRSEDIVLSLLILSLIALPMLIIALGVRLSSPGPALFRQKRYGIDGKPIEVWKFRSMSVMENGETVTQATKGDARITPFGAFLRRTSLDELPQFINVLRGEMSIVGPRPHAIAHNEQYRKLIQGYMLRHKVKPGITGWAQINGWRGETDTLDKMEKRVEFDLDYIRHWSLWLDIKIVFLTVFKGFVDKNAY